MGKWVKTQRGTPYNRLTRYFPFKFVSKPIYRYEYDENEIKAVERQIKRSRETNYRPYRGEDAIPTIHFPICSD